ncbi:hypothetical protein PPERSA_06405 [Pseudocohnilembus persalinus]|uniref:Uncharacterized protein n=1 Tax=Pseudocohnilembus persalinus TaxID=266149 RepID=A0A0V0QR71_PSEPJ|nr:hypothetical protein PPERSA_06405 [Pseudocohnilembus persalinus]|eukprot:KRX04771.1 hypothetical protein PPERSA_06405 [Pseudocohnilembus persalinus]
MEEADLSSQNFNAKAWLQQQLQARQNSGQNLELQLTEMQFNMKLLQQQTEEQVISAQEILDSNQDQIINVSEEALEQFDEIKKFLDSHLEEDKIQKFSKVNEDLFNKINESVNFKKKLDYQINTLDGILQMEYHTEDVRKLIENNNVQQLLEKLESIKLTLQILFELPKSERIKQSTLITEIYKNIKEQNQGESSILELQILIDNVINQIKREGEYLYLFKNEKQFQDVLSECMTLFIKNCVQIMNKKLQQKYFENKNVNEILEFHKLYLGFLDFIQNLNLNQNIINDVGLKMLNELLFQPFTKLVQIQTVNQCQSIELKFQKMLKNHKNLIQDASAQEKMLELQFLDLLDNFTSTFDQIHVERLVAKLFKRHIHQVLKILRIVD